MVSKDERKQLKADIRVFEQVLDTQKHRNPDDPLVEALQKEIDKRKAQLKEDK